MNKLKNKTPFLLIVVCLFIGGLVNSTMSASAVAPNPSGHVYFAAQVPPQIADKHLCGDSPSVHTTIGIGCRGKGNPIMDMLFAVIRFLSFGVGLVVIGSIIVGGIQYTASAGDPQATAKAIGRIRSSLIALGIYIFAYPLLNYVIPAGFFK